MQNARLVSSIERAPSSCDGPCLSLFFLLVFLHSSRMNDWRGTRFEGARCGKLAILTALSLCRNFVRQIFLSLLASHALSLSLVSSNNASNEAICAGTLKRVNVRIQCSKLACSAVDPTVATSNLQEQSRCNRNVLVCKCRHRLKHKLSHSCEWAIPEIPFLL